MLKLNRGHGACLLLCLVWAAYYALSKRLLNSHLVSVTGVAFVDRLAIVAVLFAPFQSVARERRAVRGRHWAYLVWVAANFTILNYSFFWAFRWYGQGVANAAVLLRTDLIFSILLGRIFFHERARPKELLALAGMVAGVFLITKVSLRDYRFQVIGDLLVIGTAFLLTVNAFIIRFALEPCHNTAIAFYNSWGSLGMVALIYFALEWQGGACTRDVEAFLAHPGLLAANLVLGALEAALILLYYYCLYRFPVWEVRAYLLFIPFFAALIAWLTPSLREALTVRQLAGMATVTVFGLWLMALSRAREGAAGG